MNKNVMELNLRDTAFLVRNGKSPIKCEKCGVFDIPYIKKSHYTPMFETDLYKVECVHCGAYIKFINEHQYDSGKYEKC